MVTIVTGFPGSGKSYFAERFARKTGAHYLSSDILRKELFPKPEYTSAEKEQVYTQLLQKAKSMLELNKDIVIDGTFYKEGLRKKFINELTGRVTPVFIEVVADENIIKERISKKRKYSDADYEIYKKIKQEWEPISSKHLILHSTNDNIDELIRQAKAYIDP